MAKNDSHLSENTKSTHETAPIKQKHRAAMGEKITGTSNPYGSPTGPTNNEIGNNQGKKY